MPHAHPSGRSHSPALRGAEKPLTRDATRSGPPGSSAAENAPAGEPLVTTSTLDVVAFAHAISDKSWGLPLDAANRTGARAAITALAGRSFAVVPSSDILAIDCDAAGDPSTTHARLEALDRVRAALEAAGCTPVLIASGRPGHRHLFARVGISPRHRSALERWCRHVGLDVRTNGIRPPGAPHRSGHPSELLSPAPELALAALLGPPAPGALATLCRHLNLGVLSPRMWSVLRDGHVAGGYESPSEARMALAIAAGAAGHSPEWLGTALNDPRNALGTTWRRRGALWQARELSRLWSKAVAWRATHPRPEPFPGRPEALEALEHWRSALAAEEWRGMAGATDLAVAEGLGRLAAGAGGPVTTASLPQIALAGGVSLCTARRSLRRLIGRGWLRQVEAPTPTKASVWRLLVPEHLERRPGLTDTMPCVEPRAPDDEAIADLGADLARWRGIGKSAARVLRELGPEPVATATLAKRLGASTNAVALQLRRLARLGLAMRGAGGWARGRADPRRVARDLGVAGRRAADAAHYAEQRRARAGARERFVEALRDATRAAAAGDGRRFRACAELLPPALRARLWSSGLAHAPPA